jgi:hypothetical protein
VSFLDLYQGDQAQAATIQPNEGHDLPSGFDENFPAAWSDGLLFSQSVERDNARASVLGDYIDEIRQKTGNDLSQELTPDISGNQIGVTNFDQVNTRVADLKAKFPDLDINPLSEDEINQRALAKAQAAHRNYAALQAGERTAGGWFGSFLGSAASSAADPVNLVALAVAPETGGASILGAALRWGALAGVSQAAIEANSNTFKEQVQPGYNESLQPLKEVAGAAIGGALLGGGFKALGNAWTRVKTGAWPTSVRDAGNVIESEAHVAETNPFPGAEGEVAHREALVKTIDDILANRPVDVSAQVTPELQQSAVEAARAQVVPEEPSGLPPEQLTLPLDPETEPMAPKIVTEPGPQPALQTPEQMTETLTAPDHQDAIRADIDRERALGDVQVPGVDEMGNHTMVSVDAAMDEVDAYKQAAEQIQACANPVQEAAE